VALDEGEVLGQLAPVVLDPEEREDRLRVGAAQDLDELLLAQRLNPAEEVGPAPGGGFQERPRQVEVDGDAVAQVQRQHGRERLQHLAQPLVVVVTVGDEVLVAVMDQGQPRCG